MDVSISGWIALIGSITWVLPWLAHCHPDNKGEYNRGKDLSYVLIETKLVNILSSLLIFVGVLCALLMLYQGFHLLGEGWDPWGQSTVDPSVIGKNAARSRGRGGIIVLLINFFPYFLISSSLYTLFTGRKLIQDHFKILGRLSWYIKLLIEEVHVDEDTLNDQAVELGYFNELCANGRTESEALEEMRDQVFDGVIAWRNLFDKDSNMKPITPQERKYLKQRYLLKKKAALYNPFLFFNDQDPS